MAKKEKTEMDDGGGDNVLDDRREGKRARATTRIGMVGSCALAPAPRHATPTWEARGLAPGTQGPSRLCAQSTLCGRRVDVGVV